MGYCSSPLQLAALKLIMGQIRVVEEGMAQGMAQITQQGMAETKAQMVVQETAIIKVQLTPIIKVQLTPITALIMVPPTAQTKVQPMALITVLIKALPTTLLTLQEIMVPLEMALTTVQAMTLVMVQTLGTTLMGTTERPPPMLEVLIKVEGRERERAGSVHLFLGMVTFFIDILTIQRGKNGNNRGRQ